MNSRLPLDCVYEQAKAHGLARVSGLSRQVSFPNYSGPLKATLDGIFPESAPHSPDFAWFHDAKVMPKFDVNPGLHVFILEAPKALNENLDQGRKVHDLVDEAFDIARKAGRDGSFLCAVGVYPESNTGNSSCDRGVFRRNGSAELSSLLLDHGALILQIASTDRVHVGGRLHAFFRAIASKSLHEMEGVVLPERYLTRSFKP